MWVCSVGIVFGVLIAFCASSNSVFVAYEYELYFFDNRDGNGDVEAPNAF
jgi:hypothetical protein